MTVTTRDIEYRADGTTIRGHLAVPAGAGEPPAVLIAHDGPGLAGHQRCRASALAAAESKRAVLGIRFVSVLPQLTSATALGAVYVAAYAARQGADVATPADGQGLGAHPRAGRPGHHRPGHRPRPRPRSLPAHRR